MLFRMVPFPTPYTRPFPRLEVRNPHPKLQSLLSHERVKLRTSNLAHHSQGSSEQKPIKISEKRQRGRIQGLPIFLSTPIISGTGKAATSNFVRTFIGSIRSKAHENFREK